MEVTNVPVVPEEPVVVPGEIVTDKTPETITPEAVADEELKIKKYLEQFKTPEELAKAKMSSDREYSKLQADAKALKLINLATIEASEKKLVTRDRTYLLELASENPALAKKLSMEVYGKDLSTYTEELLDQESKKYTKIGKDEEGKEVKMVSESDLEKILSLRLKSEQSKALRELESKREETTAKEYLNTFLKEKGIDTDSEVYKSIKNTYKGLVEGNEKNLSYVKLATTAAYNDFYIQNKTEFDKIQKQKEQLGSGLFTIGSGGAEGPTTAVFTQEEIESAKYANMSPARYRELTTKWGRKG